MSDGCGNFLDLDRSALTFFLLVIPLLSRSIFVVRVRLLLLAFAYRSKLKNYAIINRTQKNELQGKEGGNERF